MSEPGKTTKQVHLVFGGGGVRCLSYIGAVRELEKRGYAFKSVSGCSAGTILAALIAAGKTIDELYDVFVEQRTLSIRKIAGNPRLRGILAALFPRWSPRANIFRHNNFARIFNQIVGYDKKLGELQDVHFSTAAVDITKKRIIILSSQCPGHRDVPLSRAIEIANALPPLFPPAEFYGRQVVDLVYASQNPAFLAARHQDNLPIVMIQSPNSTFAGKGRSHQDYLTDLVLAGINSSDYYTNHNIARLTQVAIESDIDPYDLGLKKDQRRALVERGAREMERIIKAVGPEGFPVSRSYDEKPPARENPGDWAEWEAERSISAQLRESLELPKVFISYAREDRPWLRNFLYTWLTTSNTPIWRDTLIQPSREWEEEIRKHINGAEVAVLLVSQSFLASDFIMQTELPLIQARVDRDELKLFWIVLDDCDYQNAPGFESVRRFQAVNGDRPLNAIPDDQDWENLLAGACRAILEETSY